MSIKDINKTKRKMKNYCSLLVDNIMEQLLANQNMMIASSGDECLSLKLNEFKIQVIVDVQPSDGSKPFEIGNKSSIDLK